MILYIGFLIFVLFIPECGVVLLSSPRPPLLLLVSDNKPEKNNHHPLLGSVSCVWAPELPSAPSSPSPAQIPAGKGLSPGTGSAPRPGGHRDTQHPQGPRDRLVAWQINTKMSFLLHIPHPGDTGWVPAEQSRIRPWQGCKALHSSDFEVLQNPPGSEVPAPSARNPAAFHGITLKEWVLLIKTRVNI